MDLIYIFFYIIIIEIQNNNTFRMLLKNCSLPFKSLTNFVSYKFGAHAHKVTNVIESKHNPLK